MWALATLRGSAQVNFRCTSISTYRVLRSYYSLFRHPGIVPPTFRSSAVTRGSYRRSSGSSSGVGVRNIKADVVAKTPGEIKAEKRLRIITAIGAPILIVAGLATLVVNSPNIRAHVENYMPGFGT